MDVTPYTPPAPRRREKRCTTGGCLGGDVLPLLYGDYNKTIIRISPKQPVEWKVRGFFLFFAWLM